MLYTRCAKIEKKKIPAPLQTNEGNKEEGKKWKEDMPARPTPVAIFKSRDPHSKRETS